MGISLWDHVKSQPGNLWAVGLGLLAVTVVAAMVQAVGANVVPITAVITGPLITAAVAGPRWTIGVGVVAIAATLALGLAEDLTLSGILARLSLVVMGAGAASVLADARAQRDQAIEDERTAREADLRSMFESSAVGMLLVDSNGVITAANKAVEDALGFPEAVVVGQEADARLHPDDKIPQQKADLIAGRISSWEGTVRVEHADGSWRWVIVTASLIHSGTGAHASSALVQLLDVTAAKRAEAELTSMVNALREGLMIFDTRAVIQTANPAVVELYGLGPDAIRPGGRIPQELIDRLVDETGRPLPEGTASLERAIAGETVRDEVRGYEHPDGRRRWFSVSTSAFEMGGHRRIAVSLIDITDRYTLEQVLHDEAIHDPLTGLLNRRAMDDRLDLAAKARAGGMAVLFLDLDGFKPINDDLGHSVGDEVLVQIGQRLTSSVRPDDAVARYAGDEFVIVCPGCDTVEEAESIAKRVIAVFSDTLDTSAGPIKVGASLGVCHVALPSTRARSELLRTADAALYRSKAAGGSSYEVVALP